MREEETHARAGSEARQGRVLVTDGETRPALACVRSLGRRGLEVHVASMGRSLAGASRYTKAEHVVPDPAREPAAWCEALEALAAALEPDLVLAITEVAIGNLLRGNAAARLPVLLPSREAWERATDKAALLELAAEHGLAVPRSVALSEPAACEALPPGFEFPVVLKARRSRWWDGSGWRAGPVRIARNPEELCRAARDPGLAGGALLQEHVPGWGEGLFFLVERGRVRARFAHRRLREKPPEGGVSVLCESIEPDPRLVGRAERLLASLGWHGLAMLELRRRPDGEARVMELNPRPWGSLQLAVDAGVDFPWMLYALRCRLPFSAPRGRTGVRVRWLLGDLDHLLIRLRSPGGKGGRKRWAERARAAGAFLAAFLEDARLEVLRAGDARPFAREWRQWWHQLKRSVG